MTTQAHKQAQQTGTKDLPDKVLILKLLHLIEIDSSQLLLPLESLLINTPLHKHTQSGCKTSDGTQGVENVKQHACRL